MAIVIPPPPPPAPAATASYSVTVLPMRAGGAPLGVVVLDDVDPAAYMFDLRRRIVRLVRGDTPARVYIFLYRVDLTLDAFPDHADWSFLSALPLSQLFHRVGYPAPFTILYESTVRACLADAPDLLVATRPQPPRVIHFIAEIVEMPRVQTYPLPLPSRYNCHRRLLADVDADAFVQLQRFLSSPPEPASASCTSASPPLYLAHVPAIAQLTLAEGKLFARQGFDTLLDDILEGMANEKPFVYITATAGAGKTAFLWYVLHTLCRRGCSSCGQWPAPPMDIVVDVPGWFGLIDTAGQVFTGPRRKCFRVELLKKETLYLVDLGQGDRHELPRTRKRYGVLGEDMNESDCKFEAESHDDRMGNGQDGSRQADSLRATLGNASQLVVGLPRHSVRLRAAFENYTAVRFLPPWRDDELELCRRACFPALDASLLVSRVELWGCLPRRTLAPDPAEGVGEQQLDEWVGNVDWLAHIMSAVVEKYIKTEPDGSIPPMRDDATQVLELLPPLPKPKSHELKIPRCWRFAWGSLRVRDAVFSHLFDLQKRDDAWKLPDILQHGSLEYMYKTGWNGEEVARAYLPLMYPWSTNSRSEIESLIFARPASEGPKYSWGWNFTDNLPGYQRLYAHHPRMWL